jgi:hypothetical protein
MITCSYQNMSVQNCLIEPIEVWIHTGVQFTSSASKRAVMALSPIRNVIEISFHLSFLSEARTFSPTKLDKNASRLLSTFFRSTFDTHPFTLSLRSLTALDCQSWTDSAPCHQAKFFNAGFKWSMKWLKLPLFLMVSVLTGEFPVKAKTRSHCSVCEIRVSPRSDCMRYTYKPEHSLKRVLGTGTCLFRMRNVTYSEFLLITA